VPAGAGRGLAKGVEIMKKLLSARILGVLGAIAAVFLAAGANAKI
jgi:hypothetical protein